MSGRVHATPIRQTFERFGPPLGERPGIPAVDRHGDDGEAHIAIVSLFQGGQCHPR